MAVKKYTKREDRLVLEWAAEMHPEALLFHIFRLLFFNRIYMYKNSKKETAH